MDETPQGFRIDVKGALEDNEDGQLTPLYHPHRDSKSESSSSFFSRFKQSLSNSSLVNIFAQNTSQVNGLDISGINGINSKVPATVPSDCIYPTPDKLSSVKPVLGSIFTRPRSDTTSSFISDSSSSPTSSYFSPGVFSPVSSCSLPTLATTVTGNDLEDKWSPNFSVLSPCSTQSQSEFAPDPQPVSSDCTFNQSSLSPTSSDRTSNYDSPKGKRKGKSAARPVNEAPVGLEISGVVGDENGDWWGLEYTLDLSRRDSHHSDTSSSNTGEHSKSRASWAALHQSSISSIYADASFQEWQYWHRALERAELRRRRKRTIDFIEESSYMANLFVDETYAKRAIEIHESILTPDEISDAQLWVEYAVERRPDPYYPPENHDLAWVLKGHRSFTCLRELKESPECDS